MDDSFAAFEVGAQAQHAAPVVRACTRFVSCSCCNSFSSSVIGHWWPRFILFLLSFILASRWTRLMYLGDVLLFSFVIPPASMHRGCAIQRCALRCSVFEACFNRIYYSIKNESSCCATHLDSPPPSFHTSFTFLLTLFHPTPFPLPFTFRIFLTSCWTLSNNRGSSSSKTQ